MEDLFRLHTADIPVFVFRAIMNALSIFIIVRLIYYPRHKNNDFVFTFFLFNAANFIICLFLSTSKFEMGFAFGLFAIFSIIRYRTVTVHIREMGYFFIAVALAMMNALATPDLLLILGNLLLLGLVWALDRQKNLVHESHQEILYERIDLISPEKRPELIADLKARTGINFHRVDIERVDFFRDTVRLRAHYFTHHAEGTRDHVLDDDD
ncbi:MAG: DUF4956 domain-containing protein [Rhodothermia bacterium]|nr:DUF4956 domain-containing protein [Rhodothermia bacterium]